MNIEKIKADREKAEITISRLQGYLEDNFAGDELLKSVDWLKGYVSDLELELECNKTLAEEEKDYLKIKINKDEE